MEISIKEKKAIELSNNFIEYFNKNIQDGNRADLTVLGEEIEAIKKLLNLIEKQKKEIEGKECVIETQSHNEEVFEEVIEKQRKEIEELQNKIMEKDLEIIGVEEYTKASIGEIIEHYYTANEECISIQKIQDKIDEYTNLLMSCNRFSDVDRIKALNERILILQELLEEE